jgi:HD-GYP domain-containing protein (c-di-GMP phosphodiesterase class II)
MKEYQLLRNGESSERVFMKGIDVSLIASGDGTEMVHHNIRQGTRWALTPGEDSSWEALEIVCVLDGQLKFVSPDGEKILKRGDSICASPVRNHLIFVAETDAQFLYVTSCPVWHYYSKATKDLMDLAISIEEKDGYTSDHCHRIRDLSMLIGEAMMLSTNQLHRLNYGAFFHDIGKIKVPESILLKPSKLTNEEWVIMKHHTVYGREMLENTKIPYLVSAGIVVEQHHERQDGSGYPYGLTSKDITIEASIVAVVDSYDAMTSDRVYQKGRSKQEALEEIRRCRKTLYHADVVDIFLSLSDKF